MSHAAHSRAIIMCCLTNKEGGWHVFSLKHLSAGNAMDYDPLKKNIATLIKAGYVWKFMDFDLNLFECILPIISPAASQSHGAVSGLFS